MLRGIRRRFSGTRGAPLATFTLRVIAVSPFPEEPENDEDYHPTLIVESAPAPDTPDLTPEGFAIGALLFVEWAFRRAEDMTLPLRLRALLPRLRQAVKQGRVGPESFARHRATQQERYFHHREAASFEVSLHRDDAGLYVGVKRRVADGRWNEAATLLEAATLAPYEALLRLDEPAALATLDWLTHAVERWLNEFEAGFPVAEWDPEGPLQGPPASGEGSRS
jgi:hypothetical protein